MQGVSGEDGVPHDDVLCIALCGALVGKVDDELSQDVGFAGKYVTITPVTPLTIASTSRKLCIVNE